MPVFAAKTAILKIGPYRLLERIGEGGMGTVYKGQRESTGEIVAVKVVPAHMLANPVILKRFEQEYNVARQLDHPNMVKALDFGFEGSQHYLVMEFIEGASIGDHLERDGPFTEETAIKIVSQVAEALKKAHKQGLIHRDVKPDNILLTKSGAVKLTDLGLVKEMEANQGLTRTGRGLGTPNFMAPEQFRNAKNANTLCDIYSLGATLYMMVTARLPFESDGPVDAFMKKMNNQLTPARDLNPSLSERLDWAIRRAVSADPFQRPQTCQEFLDDLTGESTRRIDGPASSTAQDRWYLYFYDQDGILHTLKGTLEGVRKGIQFGEFGDPEKIRISKTKQGPFDSIRKFPEFRDLHLQPGPALPSDVAKPADKPSEVAVPTRSSSVVRLVPGTSSSDQTTLKIPLTPTESAGPVEESWKWTFFFLLSILAGIFSYFAIPYAFSRLWWHSH